jgi:hypothetical protein
MMRKSLLAASVWLMMLGMVVHSADPIQEPTKKEIEDASNRATLVSDLGLAAELSAFGRGQTLEATTPKNFKSPESLVLAGGIYLRADKAIGGKAAEIDVKPTDEKGTAIDGKAEKAKSFKDQGQDLFEEARLMVAETKDKARIAAIEEMIKREEKSEPDRGSVGGPKRVMRIIPPGATHNYRLGFFSGVPAAVAMQSTGNSRLRFSITHVGGNNLVNLAGLNAMYNWVPVRDRNNIRMFDVTITNTGRNPTQYLLVTN